MDQRAYNTVSAVIFLIVALAHLLRAVAGWAVQIGAFDIPIWISWLGFVVAGALAYFGFRHSGRASHLDG